MQTMAHTIFRFSKLLFIHFMQDSILSTTATKRLYSQKGILIGALMGGPLIAGYLLTRNNAALEQKGKNRQTWLLCISAFSIITALIFLLPQQVPSFLFLFLNAAFGYYATQNLQAEMINTHIASGGPLHSNWRCAGIALIFTALVIAIALATFFAIDVYTGHLSV